MIKYDLCKKLFWRYFRQYCLRNGILVGMLLVLIFSRSVVMVGLTCLVSILSMGISGNKINNLSEYNELSVIDNPELILTVQGIIVLLNSILYIIFLSSGVRVYFHHFSVLSISIIASGLFVGMRVSKLCFIRCVFD